MNGNKLLVDTNIVLYFLKGNHEIEQFFAVSNIVVSFITELELQSLGTLSPENEHVIQNFLNYTLIIDINPDIKSNAVKIRREAKIKLPDAIIAATAVSMDLPLLTADKAFSKIGDPRIILYEL